jgi:hypothetical protein
MASAGGAPLAADLVEGVGAPAGVRVPVAA